MIMETKRNFVCFLVQYFKTSSRVNTMPINLDKWSKYLKNELVILFLNQVNGIRTVLYLC